ncbi:MAG: DUF2232 domain-containing protein [Candidatus Methylomirabilis oxygeniifera]|uniref:DUF2232 domain-containing protein n=1 Tax=Methylomirabilis oxygeniifera TaxID=671143 RepID=D5MK06_METO1|nr:MAG: DUF2232 domain-containing protein [Candidatus Methylomirabilis oxyfera]CBE67589.1 conserved membrane protein of unknown function [Candidatus Methylomirabilis oxyfera]
MKERSVGRFVQGAALCLASLMLALVGGMIPVAGSFFSLLTPLPLILLSLRGGRVVALLGVCAVGIGVAGLLGFGHAWFFYIQFGLPAMVLAEAIRRQWAPEISVAVGSLTVVAGALVGLFILAWGAGGSMLDFLTHRLDIAVRDAMELYARMGVSPDEVGPLAGSGEEIRRLLLTTAPGLFMAAALLSTSVNFFLAKRGSTPVTVSGGLTPVFTWRVPDWLVWVFIGSVVLLLSGLPIAREIGFNGLLVMMTVYFLQGLAIATFWIRRLRLSPFVGFLGVALLFLQPLLLLLVTLVGLFDIWVVFRRHSLPRPPDA